jgi:hypothetical protein
MPSQPQPNVPPPTEAGQKAHRHKIRFHRPELGQLILVRRDSQVLQAIAFTMASLSASRRTA